MHFLMGVSIGILGAPTSSTGQRITGTSRFPLHHAIHGPIVPQRTGLGLSSRLVSQPIGMGFAWGMEVDTTIAS